MSAQHCEISDEGQAIGLILQHLEKQFPKVCATCDRRFHTPRDFLDHTVPVGELVCYDLNGTDAIADKPLGAVALSNCRCGSTLALTSTGMPLAHFQTLFQWVQGESARRSVSVDDFLQYIRRQIRREILRRSDLSGRRESTSLFRRGSSMQAEP
jgi:hypothetical protein